MAIAMPTQIERESAADFQRPVLLYGWKTVYHRVERVGTDLVPLCKTRRTSSVEDLTPGFADARWMTPVIVPLAIAMETNRTACKRCEQRVS
jgi:hypothetical protein